MAKLRGSKSADLLAVAMTLQLAIDSATSKKDLIKSVKVVIKQCEKWAKE